MAFLIGLQFNIFYPINDSTKFGPFKKSGTIYSLLKLEGAVIMTSDKPHSRDEYILIVNFFKIQN